MYHNPHMRQTLPKLLIRPVRIDDAAAMHAIRTHPEVIEWVTGLPTERLSGSEEYIRSLGPNDHLYVAEIQNKVVGAAGIHISSNPRMRHTATLGIMVHPAYQNKKIGKRLIEHLLHLADEMLMLVRIELIVATDNKYAIQLYRSLDFKNEGTHKYAFIKNGAYSDLLLMARYRLPK